MEQPRNGTSDTARTAALLVTNLTKLGGLTAALYEILFRSSDPHFSLVLAFAALAITGGQGLGSWLDKLLGK
jgi:hypothetical protein